MLTSGSHTCKQSRTLWELNAKVSLGHTDPKIRIQRGGWGGGKQKAGLCLKRQNLLRALLGRIPLETVVEK